MANSRRKRPPSSFKKLAMRVEEHFERFLFWSRWLVSPIYAGLALALLLLMFVFILQMITSGAHFLGYGEILFSEKKLHQVVLDVLGFIDIALVANLVLIVTFAGYYHFVSKIELDEEEEDWPPWMVEVDFADLKLKLFASIIALTGIELLKAFMNLRSDQLSTAPKPPDSESLMWLVIIHVTFLFTALLSAIADRLTAYSRTKN